MRVAISSVGLFFTANVVVACASGPPPGMSVHHPEPHGDDPELVVLARAISDESTRALLVVYPRTSCSGSASMVFVDERGRFVGAVAPGSASLLRVPRLATKLGVFSSVEVTAPVGTWFVANTVAVPAAPSGLLLEAQSVGTLGCGSGHYADVVTATKAELEGALGEQSFLWLAPETRDGQAWLDAHRARVAELRGRGPAPGLPWPALSWVAPLQAKR